MTWWKHAAVIDFETLPIEKRPDYPPLPVGVAIRIPGRRPRYYAWGHPTENNCTWSDARSALGEVYVSDRPLLFHNAKFDVDVAEEHMRLPLPHWRRIHDTMHLLFLDDPRAPSFALKPAAERLLGEPPEERDAVIDWLTEHQPVPGLRLKPTGKKAYAGAYVALAPGKLAGTYAIGDVGRTDRLAKHLAPSIERRGMRAAYDLERELMPYILEMERTGIRLAHRRLAKDLRGYEAALERLDVWIKKRLKVGESFNLDSGAQLAPALISAGVAHEEDFGLTPTGKLATSKDALERAVTNPQVLAALRYRSALGVSLKTFLRPWKATADHTGGIIHTSWRAGRSDDGGAATGRFASSPNFQNLSNAYKGFFGGQGQPKAPVALPVLPNIRSYIVPHAKGEVLIGRDYSQQEPRILAHFMGGSILQAYQNDPRMDMHVFAQNLLNDILNANYERKPVKQIGLGLLYGMGLGKLAASADTDVETARKLKSTYLDMFPGLRDMYREMKRRAAAGEPIHTWGGREYYVEPPKMINGKWREFDYKLLNVLIQGSAADCMKVAMRMYLRTRPRHHKLLLSVYDELLVSVPRAERDPAMAHLRAAMESVRFDVPMFSEGMWSPRNWSAMKTYDKKGRIYAR